MKKRIAQRAAPVGNARVAHAADFYRRYPGEIVTFFTRVMPEPGWQNVQLRITLADGLEYSDCRAIHLPAGTTPFFSKADGMTHLIWEVNIEELASPCEFWVKAVVSPTREDRVFESKAVITTEDDAVYEEEIVSIAVAAKGRYLQYLPAIYQDDEFMGRFLMLFESFLMPVDWQIKNGSVYYDARLTPPKFLPWLASWTGIVFDEQLSEKTRRRLLTAAASLFRRRGTRQMLQEFLEIYTGGKVEIVEHFSENFRLGMGSYLGPGIAFGQGNIPNTFSVNVRIPVDPGWQSLEERRRACGWMERKVSMLIDAEKPAHTGFELTVAVDSRLAWQS